MDCARTVTSALRKLEGEWKIVIINELMAIPATPLRFSELERLVDGVSQKMLISQLKQLERDGIVHRRLYPQVPPKVEYSLAGFGRGLQPAMQALIDWAQSPVAR